jgi:hypothetical protein
MGVSLANAVVDIERDKREMQDIAVKSQINWIHQQDLETLSAHRDPRQRQKYCENAVVV